MANEQAIINIQALTARYAEAADRRDVNLLLSTVTADAEVVMPGSAMKGHEVLSGIPAILDSMFEKTQHKIFNQTLSINGNRAEGETYCTASHLRVKEDGTREVEDWAIRYQDRLVCVDAVWLFERRELVVDWVEIRPAMLFGEQFA
tara:strand:- start:1770 stop:2210 length:441 start_codon:yes stop_codon:yes gene_type:complete